LFVVFAGKKQLKPVGKMPENWKKIELEVMTTFQKIWQNAQILLSRVSRFLMKNRSRSLNQVSISKVTVATT